MLNALSNVRFFFIQTLFYVRFFAFGKPVFGRKAIPRYKSCFILAYEIYLDNNLIAYQEAAAYVLPFF